MNEVRVVVSWLLLFTACRPWELPAPVVVGAEPPFAYNGDDETVTLLGSDFWPEVTIDARRGDPDLDQTFTAWLIGPDGDGEKFPFASVGWVDDQHLTATLEAGTPAGRFDLVVEGPTGRRGRRDDAFTVTDTQAAQLVLSSERLVYDLTAIAAVEVRLVDLGGDVVPIPFEVAVVASPPETSGVGGGNLLGAVPTPDGDGVRGVIVDGSAAIPLTVTTPGTYTVSIAPWDSASPVLGDTLDLVFVPGADRAVALRLGPGGGPYEFVAGEPFPIEAELVDQYGNPVAEPASVTLRTDCSGWIADVTLSGPTPVEVLPIFTTSVACPTDRVRVVRGPAGESDPFTVRAGPIDHFSVLAAPSTARAGDEVDVLVDPEDAYGNRTPWSGALVFDITGGGLLATTCSPIGSVQVCTTTVTRAGAAEIVRARSIADGVEGRSNPIVVLADDVPAEIGVTAPTLATAGEAFDVEVRPVDGWGNPMVAADLGPGGIVVQDDLAEADCVEQAALPDGAAAFRCTLFTARDGAVLTASIPAFSLSADSAPIRVENGPLAAVELTAPDTVTAGVAAAIGLVGRDAWGNPYLVQVDPVVDLRDDGDSWSPATATLGPLGTATLAGTLTRAGPTRIRASQAGVELGVSDPVQVLPAATDALALLPLGPWAWQGTPLELRVEAVDAFGNRTDLGATATVSSTATASPSIVVTLVNGVGQAPFTWSDTAFVDRLQAVSGVYTGEVDLAVSRVCAVGGPTAALDFAGFPVAQVCLDPGTQTALVNGDLGGSTAGAAPLVGFALAELGGSVAHDTGPSLDLELAGAGRHALAGLVVAGDGCGAEAFADGWAGPDDGSPTGPLTLSASAATIGVTGVVTVDLVGAVDCARAPAGGQVVRLRSTAGTLSGVVPSGAGLELALDPTGDGTATLTTAGGLSAGTAEVHAWVPSGAAGGRLDLSVVGDGVRPTVVDQAPAGTTLGPVSEVRLWFSEPMQAASVVPANFVVTGPTAVTVLAATLEPGGEEVALTLSAGVDGTLGVYTVRATSALRDVANNRLAGDWAAAAADYLGAFGDLGGGVDPVVCPAVDPSGLLFRPDGDPGVGAESDAVVLSLESAQAPAWWVLEVRDGADARVVQDWTVPVGPVDQVSWDGRDRRGLLVPNGAYRIAVWPDDGLGNQGVGCEVTVTVDNERGDP